MLDTETYDFTPCTAMAGLLFVKSRSLLPWQNPLDEPELDEFEIPRDEEEEPTEVRERLMALYEVFRDAAEFLRGRVDAMQERLRPLRPDSPSILDEVTFVDKVTAFDLLLVMNQILRRAADPAMYHVKVDDTFILNQRIAEVFDFLIQRAGRETKFADVVPQTAPRVQAVLTFMAIIYLMHQDKISAWQKLPYGDIFMSVRAANAADGSAPS